MEFILATSCVCHAIWLKNLLEVLNLPQKEPTYIYVDNESTTTLSKILVFHDWSKRINTRHDFIRECIVKKEVQLKFTKFRDKIGDIFTKPLKFEDFRKLKMLLEVTN